VLQRDSESSCQRMYLCVPYNFGWITVVCLYSINGMICLMKDRQVLCVIRMNVGFESPICRKRLASLLCADVLSIIPIICHCSVHSNYRCVNKIWLARTQRRLQIQLSGGLAAICHFCKHEYIFKIKHLCSVAYLRDWVQVHVEVHISVYLNNSTLKLEGTH
jgi:hypothetical protein